MALTKANDFLRPVDTVGGITIIPLTQGRQAVIDSDDAHLVASLNWCAVRDGRTYYATSKQRQFLMHRVIMGAKPGQIVDHINGDGLDNRRCNLRFVDVRQNQWNARVRVDNKTGIKGVSRRGDRYCAAIKIAGRVKHLGTYDTAGEAAEAYAKAALEARGPFAETKRGALR